MAERLPLRIYYPFSLLFTVTYYLSSEFIICAQRLGVVPYDGREKSRRISS